MEDIKCPKCHSTQLTANKKGFSGAKALGGAVLVGGVGLLAGTIGSNKVLITCLRCGHQFKAGEYEHEIENENRNLRIASDMANGKRSFLPAVIMGLFTATGSLLSYNLLDSDLTILGIIFLIATVICFLLTIAFIYTETQKTSRKDLPKNDITQKQTIVNRPKQGSTPFVAKQKIKCPECNTCNILQAKYCMECGLKLDISKMETVNNENSYDFILCNNCKDYTPSSSKYCIYCGTMHEV